MPRVPDGEGLPLGAVLDPAGDADDLRRDRRRRSSATAAFSSTRRQEGVHLAGLWEFPGGKCDPGESLATCLVRELREELDVDVGSADELFATTHEYADRTVELHFLQCELLGDPVPQLGQEMRWVSRQELGMLEFPPADAELIHVLAAQS